MFYLFQCSQVLSRFANSSLTSLTPESLFKDHLPSLHLLPDTLLRVGWEMGEEMNEATWPHINNC